MPETRGLAGSCRSLFAQRTSPGAGEQRRYPIISRIAMALQAHGIKALQLGSVRLLKENKRSTDGQPPRARLKCDAIRSPTLRTSVPGVRRWARPCVGDV